MTTIVLGWDALDPDLVRKWGLTNAFGQDGFGEMETIVNEQAGEPLTRELWPTMLMGAPPAQHGLRAQSDDGSIEWADNRLNRLASLAADVVPQSIRAAVGTHLRDRGHSVRQHGPEHDAYQEFGTVFDEVDGLPISLPNYQTQHDRDLGLSVDRTSIWQDVLQTAETEDGTVYEPLVGQQELDERLVSKARRRLGIVEAAVGTHDLVWCWLGYLDTVGHLAPAVGGRDWQREHYERAGRWTEQLRLLPGVDTVVSVSDHGLQDGVHTETAAVGVDTAVDQLPGSVTEVRAFVTGLVSDSDSSWRVEEVDRGAIAGVEEELEALGYV